MRSTDRKVNPSIMDKPLTLKQKYFLTKVEPKLFYIKFYSTAKAYLDDEVILKKERNSMLLGNN